MVNFKETKTKKKATKNQVDDSIAISEEDKSSAPIINHIKDTEELLEYVVVKINELTEMNTNFQEQINELQQKANTAITVESIEPKNFKRKIVLNRDASGKIVGADVIDSVDAG